MNSGAIRAIQINLKFFEPGHSFMAADSTHSKLEKGAEKMQGKIYDYDDLISTFEKTGVQVVTLNLEDFTDWKSEVSDYKLSKARSQCQKDGTEGPYLKHMCWIRFSKEDDITEVSYKADFDQPEFEIFNYWKVKQTKHDRRKSHRGILKEKRRKL